MVISLLALRQNGDKTIDNLAKWWWGHWQCVKMMIRPLAIGQNGDKTIWQRPFIISLNGDKAIHNQPKWWYKIIFIIRQNGDCGHWLPGNCLAWLWFFGLRISIRHRYMSIRHDRNSYLMPWGKIVKANGMSSIMVIRHWQSSTSYYCSGHEKHWGLWTVPKLLTR
jgi:hypothetical protein